MWLETLMEATRGISPKTLSERTKGHLPERTIIRILTGETAHPRIDTLIELGLAAGLSPQDLFSDTNVIVATETLAEVKEAAVEAEAKQEIVTAENEIIASKLAAAEARIVALESELALVKQDNAHKAELLAVYNYFTKIKVD
jgi:hypothetical protein